VLDRADDGGEVGFLACGGVMGARLMLYGGGCARHPCLHSPKAL
jgi:hypothetical protein